MTWSNILAYKSLCKYSLWGMKGVGVERREEDEPTFDVCEV